MKRFVLIPILVFFAFLIPSKEITFAEGGIAWTEYYPQGVPVCTGFTTEQNIRMAPDGSGGAIIVWEDFRGADVDIYAQRIDENGVPQWDPNGVPVCTVPSNQLLPVIVGDGSGGAIIAWEDYRAADPNIYAVRISSDTGGTSTGWPSTGVALSPSTYQQLCPDIVSDDSGGAIITWWEYDPVAIEWMIRAQSITSAGGLPWGMATTISQGGPKWYPKIVNDGTGYVIITWQDYRVSDYDIYAQRVDIINGAIDPIWALDGQPVTEAIDNQLEPEIVSDGSGGAIITWTDWRDAATAPDIYAQRIDSYGDPVAGWTPDGTPVCKETNEQYKPVIINSLVEGTIDGAIIAWEDRRYDENGDIYAVKVHLDGAPDFTKGAVAIATGNQSQMWPRLVSDNQGGGIGTWIEDDATGSKIFAQKGDEYGVLVWSSYPGVLVCEGIEIWDSQIISDGSGGAIVAWMGRGLGIDYDIYAQRVIDEAVTQILAPLSGRVTHSDGETGITGVLVEALSDDEVVSSVTTDTNGDYELAVVAGSTYTVRATWMVEDIESSVSKEAFAPSYSFNFTLEIDYELGTIAGNVSGVEGKYVASLSRVESKRISGAGVQKSLSPGSGIAFVELEQKDKVIVRVPVEMEGNYTIPNLLPGRFIARAYNGTIYSKPRMVHLKEGETLKVNFAFSIMPGKTVYNYPNPAKSGSTTIRYYCGYSEPEAEIKIYNIAGELVRKVRDSEIDKTDADEHIYRFLWDCKNSSGKEIASGVYIYIVEVKEKSSGETKKVIKRMAVIR